MSNTEKEYFLDTDNDGHWYVIPVEKRSLWEDWCNLNPDSPLAWNEPDYATRVGGAPNMVTFRRPQILL